MDLRKGARWFLLLAGTMPSLAQDVGSRWQFGGFGTLGVMGTDSHQLGYYRDITQPSPGAQDQPNLKTDSRLGLQISYAFSDNLTGTVQEVSRLNWDGSFKPTLNWAFLKWNPLADLELRAGRLGVELNSMGDSRDVGFSYLTVRPPQELYAAFAVNAFNGLDVASTFQMPGHLSLRVKGFAGTLVGNIPLEGYNQPLKWNGDPTWGLLAELGGDGWRFKVSWSTFTNRNNWPPNGTPYISDVLDQFAAALNEPVLQSAGTSLSIVNWKESWLSGMFSWERGPIQFQTEIERTSSNRVILPGAWGGASTLGYRLGEVVPFVQYARTATDAQNLDLDHLSSVPVEGPLLVSAIQGALQDTVTRQNTITAGARWDFTSKACLKVQVDQVKISEGHGMFYPLEPGGKDKVRVFSVTLDFVFGGGRR